MLEGKFKNEQKENSCNSCLNCLYFSQNKVFPFLRNVNNAVSYNDKDEVETMKNAIPNISNSTTHYASQCLCAKVQFSKIDAIMQSMKTKPSILYMVPYHKQKVLHMRFCKGQVAYFGNKVMSLMDMM